MLPTIIDKVGLGWGYQNITKKSFYNIIINIFPSFASFVSLDNIIIEEKEEKIKMTQMNLDDTNERNTKKVDDTNERNDTNDSYVDTNTCKDEAFNYNELIKQFDIFSDGNETNEQNFVIWLLENHDTIKQ